MVSLNQKKKKTFDTDFGIFKLIQENFWLCENEHLKIFYYVNGDNEKPHQDEIEFLKKIDKEIERLDNDINIKLMALYRELDLPIYFNHWRERLRIYSYQIFELKNVNLIGHLHYSMTIHTMMMV